MEISPVTSVAPLLFPTAFQSTPTGSEATADDGKSLADVFVDLSPEARALTAQAFAQSLQHRTATGLLAGLSSELLATEVTSTSIDPLLPDPATEGLTRAESMSIQGQLAAYDTATALVASAVGLERSEPAAGSPVSILTSSGASMTRAEAYAAYTLLNTFSVQTSLIRAIA